MAAKRCPSCGLVNPELAVRCDCGYDFSTARIEKSDISRKQGAELAQRAFVLSVVSFFCVGIVLAPYALHVASQAAAHQLDKASAERVSNARVIAMIVLALWVFGLGLRVVIGLTLAEDAG